MGIDFLYQPDGTIFEMWAQGSASPANGFRHTQPVVQVETLVKVIWVVVEIQSDPLASLFLHGSS